MPKPQSLRQGWQVHESQGVEARRKAGQAEGLLMNWQDVLPENLAISQELWERRHRARRAVEAGASIQDVAARLNITPARVGQILKRAEFDMQGKRQAPICEFLEMRAALADVTGAHVAFVADDHRQVSGPPRVYGVKETVWL